MSLAQFANGFLDGTKAGVLLGRAVREGRNANAISKGTEILSEMQNMIPGVSQTAAIPDGKGAGETSSGYDGKSWNDKKAQYIEAMKGVNDPRILDAMMDQMADLEKGKVLEYGRMAIASLKAGDNKAAQNYLAAMSYYTDPGSTPMVNVQPDGTVLYHSPGGKPMALKAKNIEDMMHQFVDFDGYRDLAFDREQHADMMEYREQVRLDRIAEFNAQQALRERDLDSLIEQRDANMHLTDTRIDATKQSMRIEMDKWGLTQDQAVLNMDEQQRNMDIKETEAASVIKRRDLLNDQTEQQIRFADELHQQSIDAALVALSDKERDEVNGRIADAAKHIKDYVDLDSTKGLRTGGGDDELGLGPTALPDDMHPNSKAAIQAAQNEGMVIDELNQLRAKETQKAQMQVIHALSSPQVMADVEGVVTALVMGDKHMSGSRAANIALTSILGNGSGYETFFDTSTGNLMIVGPDGKRDYYRTPASHHRLLGARFDAPPKNQPPPMQRPQGGQTAIPQ